MASRISEKICERSASCVILVSNQMSECKTNNTEEQTVKKVLLGNTGIEVSIAGIGILPMGPSQLALPVDVGAKIIKYAFDHGMNFIDTA